MMRKSATADLRVSGLPEIGIMMRKSAAADLRAAVSKDGSTRPWFETAACGRLLTMRAVFVGVAYATICPLALRMFMIAALRR